MLKNVLLRECTVEFSRPRLIFANRTGILLTMFQDLFGDSPFSRSHHTYSLTWLTLLASFVSEYTPFVASKNCEEGESVSHQMGHREFPSYHVYWPNKPFLAHCSCAMLPCPHDLHSSNTNGSIQDFQISTGSPCRVTPHAISHFCISATLSPNK